MSMSGRNTFAQMFRLPPEAHTNEFYKEHAKKFVEVGKYSVVRFEDLDYAYNDMPYGSKRKSCKCLATYPHGALFLFEGMNANFTFFLKWWEVYKVVG